MLMHTNFCDNAIFLDYFLDIYYLMDQVLSYDPILAVFFHIAGCYFLYFICFQQQFDDCSYTHFDYMISNATYFFFF